MSKGRTKKAFNTAMYGIIKQITNIIWNFIIRTIFIVTLGPEILGINAVFKELISVFSVVDMGVGTVLIYSMYEPLSKNNKDKVVALNNFYCQVYRLIAVVFLVLGLIGMPFLPYILKIDDILPEIYVYYYLFIANTVVSYLTVYHTSVIQANQQGYIIHRYSIISNSVIYIVQILFLIFTKNYIIFLLLQICIPFVPNFLASQKSKKLYPYLTNKKICLSRNEKHKIFYEIKDLFIYKIAYVFVNSTDAILISSIVGTIWTGLYSNYVIFVNAVTSITSVIYNSFVSSIGNLVYTESKDKMFAVFKEMQVFGLMMATFIVNCYVLLVQDVVEIWLGHKYLLADVCLYIIVGNIYFKLIMQPVWRYRDALGMYAKINKVMVIYASLNIVMSIIGGNIWGIEGILFSTILSGVLTIFIYEPWILFKENFECSVSEYYKPVVYNLIVTLGMVFINFQILNFEKNVNITNFYSLFFKAIIIIILVVVEILIMYAWQKPVKKLIYRVKSVLISHKKK